jgi:protein TonB
MSTEKPVEPMPLAATSAAGVAVATPPLIGAEKWAANSIFDRKDERKMGKAFTGSLAAHGVLVLLLLWGGFHAAQVVEQEKEKIDVVYLQQPGPGGGGGGSPTPAPPAKMEIPKPVTPPTPVPIEPVPVVAPPPPDPSLTAPITTLSNMIQANGQGAVNFAAFGGGGSGGGVGSGKGDGVGPGTGGGFGGGAYHQGNGCADPQLIHMVDPKYTSEAMRAKLQGDVELEVVVQKNGAVGDMRLTRSLDKQFGLDAAAMQAAKGWVFKPATCKGQPVDMIVGLVLEFRLH